MVRSMEVEDVHTGGLEATERGVYLLKNTLTLQTCKRKMTMKEGQQKLSMRSTNIKPSSSPLGLYGLILVPIHICK